MNDKALNKPLVIIGGGGHASVIVDILKQQNRDIIAIISPDDISKRNIFEGLNVFSNDIDIAKFKPDEVRLINGIGVLPGSEIKYKVTLFFKSMGYIFETVVANDAYVSPFASLDEGVQIFPGVIVQPGSHIGAHTVINTRATIEHDVILGAYNAISPGAIICGQCKTEDHVFIGAGATVIQNVEIGSKATIMANALVTDNVKSQQKVYAPRALIR
ncbi:MULTISPECIES: acetyltransferase [Citrobacter]|uniref:acetyltransferase n=1 Tax=Citrobacter TaxID=544 RepID=UPI0015EA72E7|nr:MULTISPECIES: acetyltransferase [Citrobacter]EHG7581693.1 acetyltransferase [Citrobacter sedlakii]EIQ7157112.1 acetyltransferase [Citrobacter sedlakii]MBN6599244.1 acetyltransferase [Citrobacter sedlakii]QMK45622.1 acetyltransferase [Citrobacter sp. RHB21-C05]QMK64066.1 acetyltransferase [Citrobacter sp. RHB21-C01]